MRASKRTIAKTEYSVIESRRNSQNALCSFLASYNQRGPLDYAFFRPFPRLVLNCINADFCDQDRIFQRFSSSTLFRIFPDFCDCSRPLRKFFSSIYATFVEFQGRQQIFQKKVVKFHKNFPNFTAFQWFWEEWCQNDNTSEKSEKNCRNYQKLRCLIWVISCNF